MKARKRIAERSPLRIAVQGYIAAGRHRGCAGDTEKEAEGEREGGTEERRDGGGGGEGEGAGKRGAGVEREGRMETRASGEEMYVCV